MFKLRPPVRLVRPLVAVFAALIIERVLPPLQEVIIIGSSQASATVGLQKDRKSTRLNSSHWE